MSNPLKSEFFCIADDDFLSIVDKLHANNLSEEDKKLIAHIMIRPSKSARKRFQSFPGK